jgi:hypothetical protein
MTRAFFTTSDTIVHNRYSLPGDYPSNPNVTYVPIMVDFVNFKFYLS